MERAAGGGVEIHEYAPSFLRQVAVVDALGDRPWATVGSSNLDRLSLLLARRDQRGGGDYGLCRPAPAPGARHRSRRPPAGLRPLRRSPLRQRVLDRLALA